MSPSSPATLALLASLALGALAAAQGPAPLTRTPTPADPAAAGLGQAVPDLELTSLQGEPLHLDALAKGPVTVLAMSSTGCPLCRTYAPRLAELEATYTPRGVTFIHINVVDGESRTDKSEFLREFALRGIYTSDTLGAARRTLRPRTTTEVFVLGADRRVLYHGAIDDQYRLGGAAPRASRHFLRDAIDAALAGLAPKTPATTAPGCLVDIPGEPAAAGAPFYPAVAATLAAHCSVCHSPGGPAPFSLLFPSDIEGRAAMLAAVIDEGLMPPSHGAAPGPARGRELPDADRSTLLAWLRSSRAVGQEPPITYPDPINTWQIGRPDLHIIAGDLALPASGEPAHQRVVTPIGLDHDLWVDQIECRTVMRDSILSALVWLLEPGEPLPAPDQVPASGQLLATYSPGDSVVRFPPGLARRIPAGSAILVDLYARPMGRPMVSQLRLGARTCDQPAAQVRSLLIQAWSFELPPRETRTVESGLTLPADRSILAIRPIMRWRGRRLTLDATSAAAQPLTLLALDRYDPRWLIRYPLTQPITLPRGARLGLRGEFDNSPGNPANPDPDARVTAGCGVSDETLMAVLEYAEPTRPNSP